MTHDELINKWDSLFTNERGEPTLTDLEVPEDWYLLIDTLCNQIQSYLMQTPDACHVQVVQIKEKFGGLRFYAEGVDSYIEGLVAMAEAYSKHL